MIKIVERCRYGRRFAFIIAAQFVVFFYIFCPDYLPTWSEQNVLHLENLTLALPNATYRSRQIPWLSHPRMPRILSLDEHEQSLQLLQAVDTLLWQHNITYVLAYGNLIGSYMMHDLLPWDDDLDILIYDKDRHKIVPLFQKYSDQGIDTMFYHNGNTQTLKLFFKNSSRAGLRSWRWPFIDVAFYDENSTHVWNMDARRQMVMDKQRFYPLHRRPLGNLWLPAPRDTRGFLTAKYGHLSCSTHPWNHRWEVPAWRVYKVPCHTLKEYYPFVSRGKAGQKLFDGGVKETLVLNEKIIYSVLIDETFQPISSIYEF